MSCKAAKKEVFVIFISLFLFLDSIKANTIIISNQNEFDDMRLQISKSIIAGEKYINVEILRGTYYFNDNHIVLSRIEAKDTRIHIKGNGAILIPRGHTYHSGDRYKGDFSYDCSWMSGDKDISIWTDLRYSDGLIEIVNEKAKLCRLKHDVFRECDLAQGISFIYITHWFESGIYKIEKIEDGFVFFTTTDLKQSVLNKDGYNINDDFFFYKSFPRFRLCNVNTKEDVLRIIDGRVVLPRSCNVAHEGRTPRFLTIQKCSFSRVDISGFCFYGNSYQASTSYIYLLELNAQEVDISDCVFKGLHGNIISIVKTDNVTIKGNTFKDCYYGGILSDNMSGHTKIMNNTFVNMGLRRLNTFCVLCRGSNYYIGGNTLRNYGCGGISVGDWSHYPHERPSSGIVEKNTLTFSPSYLKEIERTGLMDSGAIYIWTKNDGAIVRNNVIRGYSGSGGNKGIFCDNGSYGVSIIGNVVTGITNSYCITSRRVASVEESNSPGTGIEASNINNTIQDNIVDGPVTFVGHEREDNGCIIGNNYVLIPKGGDYPVYSISHVKEEGGLIALEQKADKWGKVAISRKSYKLLRKTQEWHALKRFVGRR